MKLNILIILIFILSCTASPTDNEIKYVSAANTTNTNTEIIETFVDSLNIGEKGKNKVELIKHSVFDDTYVIVKFYRKATVPNRWYNANTYIVQCNVMQGLS